MGTTHALAAAAAVWAMDPGPGAAEPRVVSNPGPGWRVASPHTGITFSGGSVATLGAVEVTGSISGPHAGRLHALRTRPGAVFTPDLPFAAGERVTVRTAARVLGARGGSYSFRVARWEGTRHTPPDLSTAASLAPWPPTARGIGGCRLRRPRYTTLPDLRPVGICMSRRGRAGAGRILVTPRSHPERNRREQHSIMILSDRGEILWYSPLPGVARDLKTVRYRGRRMLAYYQRVPHRRPYYQLLDASYRPVTRIRTRNGYRTNTHELQITRAGTAYVSAYEPVRLPGFRRPIVDFVIQEIDLPTRDVLFEWHSLDHVPPSASYEPSPRPPASWDYFHGNSIDPPSSPRGTIVVSARNTSAIYGIDRRTGKVRWTFGGKRDQFGLARGLRFCAQHDARRQPNGDITIFDNGGAALGNMRDCPLHTARVLRFRLDQRRRRARLVGAIPSGPSSRNGAGYYVWAMGSAHRQSDGSMLVDWGTTGALTLVAPGGRVGWGLQLERYSYRAIRSPWVGRPPGSPLVAAQRRGRSTMLWASWNGATKIARWRVLVGATPEELRPVKRTFRFHGLETTLRVPASARYAAVEALDADRRVLGRSATVTASRRPRRGQG